MWWGWLGGVGDLGTVLAFVNCMRLDWGFFKEQGLPFGLKQGVWPVPHNKHHLLASVLERQAQKVAFGH